MRRWLPLFALLPLVLLGVARVPDAGAVTVSMVPADTTVFLGDSFALRVMVDATPDLKGFELIHTIDAAVLGFTGETSGDVLTASARPFVNYSLPDVTAPGDSIWVDAAMLQGSSNGPGILVFYHFDAIHVGDCPIDCDAIEMRNSFNVSLAPACLGSMVHVTTRPTPALRSSWGALKLHHH